MILEKYKAKRKFEKTSEPKGVLEKKSHEVGSRFVIQKHAASHLHFDFRLEVGGTLKSWAVPKGIPKPGEKHLAMMVEDHPLEYRNFEGIIPKGNYGAGTVMIWDYGSYLLKGGNDNSEMSAKIKKGDFAFELKGKKIQGEFSLVKLKKAENNAWLLIRKNDANISQYDELSVVSRKSMEEIASKDLDLKKYPQARKSPMPDFVAPMHATFAQKPFNDKNWLFEIKWDGYRIIARKEKSAVEIFSRNKKSFKSTFAPIVESLKKIDENFIIDGEVVVIDEDGKTNFQMLQNYLTNRIGKLVYYVFDIMYLNGYDLKKIPLFLRREILSNLIEQQSLDNIRISGAIKENGLALFEQTSMHQGEGVVAKKADSQYDPNHRSLQWLKIKATLTQEAIICGFTAPKGGRKKFGALVLGVYENNKLVFIGHVGGGFDEEVLSSVFEKMKPLIIKKSPFENEPKTNTAVTWIRPELVCNVKFSEWTNEGSLRQPIFLGLRIDKDPKEIRREFPIENTATKTNVRKYSVNEKDKSESEGKIILTNLDKVFFPEDGYTKGDLIAYYKKISKYILPHLIGRPQSLNRFPNGIYGKSFFQKNMADAPSWIEKIKVYSSSEGIEKEYMLCQNEEALIYMANLGCIEINIWNSNVQNLENPDYMIFDIDPQKLQFKVAVKVAKEIKKVLDEIEMPAFCKTSGKRGLHIFVPLAPVYSFEQVTEMAKLISLVVNRRIPDVTSLQRKPSERNEKVYLDFLQNRKGQTMASVYCVRPVEGAPVSTPMEWKELNEKLNPEKFNIKTILKRLEKKGDIWQKMFTQKVDLEKSLIALEKILKDQMKKV